MLAIELHLTRVNAKTEPDEHIEAEFLREFSAVPQEVLQEAFRQWRRNSKFFPAVSDIHELVGVIQRVNKAEAEEIAREEEKKLLDKARAEGNLLDFGDLKAAIIKITEAAGKDAPKVRELAKPMPDYKPLGKQELEARRKDQLNRLAAMRAKR